MPAFEPTEISDGTRVAWVTQGIVLYLDGDLRSIWPEVQAAWVFLLRQPWAANLCAVRHWNEPAWRAWDFSQVPTFLGELAQRGPRQEYGRVTLANEPNFPALSIECRDVETTQGTFPRASSLLVRLPLDTDSRDLLDLTTQLADMLSVQQGRAGYMCHVYDPERSLSFDQAWAWARRYYGMDIVDPVVDTWDAVEGLLRVNWLTILGQRWLEDPLQTVDFDRLAAPVRSWRQKHGVVLQAGNRPSVGDQNQFEDLAAYTEVSRAVAPALIVSPTEFPGMFTDHESTNKWIRRFLDPTAWQEAS